MSKLITNADVLQCDEYFTAVQTEQTAAFISKKLAIDNTCSLALNMGEGTQYNVTFVDIRHTLHGNNWQGGRGKLFIAFERVGCFSFRNYDTMHPNYFEEKMGYKFGGEIAKRFCEFLSMIKLK